MSDWDFLGWVPCINGHLDFGLTNVGLRGGFTNEAKDKDIVEVNYAFSGHSDSHQRRIVLQSWVDWRDSSEYEPSSGLFRIFVTAEVNGTNDMDDRFLVGDLLIYPMGAEPSDLASKQSMGVHSLSHQIKECDDVSSRNSLFTELSKIVSGICPVEKIQPFFFTASLNFKIEPNGLIWIKYNTNTLANEESKFVVARQAFYYLKYAIHMHKHHTNKQDSLTTIVSLDGNSLSEVGLKLICQLKRELTTLNRTQYIDSKLHPTNDACGIIAYVKSLITALHDRRMIDDRIAAREHSRFDNIRCSFDVLNKKSSEQIAYVEGSSNKAKLWLALLVAYLFGSVGFVLTPGVIPPKMMHSQYIPFLLGGVLIVAYFSFKRFYKMNNPQNNDILYKRGYFHFAARLIVILVVALLVIFMNPILELLVNYKFSR